MKLGFLMPHHRKYSRRIKAICKNLLREKHTPLTERGPSQERAAPGCGVVGFIGAGNFIG